MHDFTALPFHITVHAPQRPTTQPMWVPVSLKVSRKKCVSNVRGSASPEYSLPFTFNELVLAMGRLRLRFLDKIQNSIRRERRLANLHAERAQRVFHRAAQRRRGSEHAGLSRTFGAERRER